MQRILAIESASDTWYPACCPVPMMTAASASSPCRVRNLRVTNEPMLCPMTKCGMPGRSSLILALTLAMSATSMSSPWSSAMNPFSSDVPP